MKTACAPRYTQGIFRGGKLTKEVQQIRSEIRGVLSGEKPKWKEGLKTLQTDNTAFVISHTRQSPQALFRGTVKIISVLISPQASIHLDFTVKKRAKAESQHQTVRRREITLQPITLVKEKRKNESNLQARRCQNAKKLGVINSFRQREERTDRKNARIALKPYFDAKKIEVSMKDNIKSRHEIANQIRENRVKSYLGKMAFKQQLPQICGWNNQ